VSIERFLINTSVTIWWTYQQLTNPYVNPPLRAYYDPATPTVAVKRPDGTYVMPAPTPIKWNATVGYYETVVKVDQIGFWAVEGSDPDATKPSGGIGHFEVYANPLT